MCVFACASLRARVQGVRMIQSAISLGEDSLHKHTHHAEDVVILHLIVCVSDVSNRHQARGGFTLPLSLSFAVAASDCTNCPVFLLPWLLLAFLPQKKVQFARTKVFIDLLDKTNKNLKKKRRAFVIKE